MYRWQCSNVASASWGEPKQTSYWWVEWCIFFLSVCIYCMSFCLSSYTLAIACMHRILDMCRFLSWCPWHQDRTRIPEKSDTVWVHGVGEAWAFTACVDKRDYLHNAEGSRNSSTVWLSMTIAVIWMPLLFVRVGTASHAVFTLTDNRRQQEAGLYLLCMQMFT